MQRHAKRSGKPSRLFQPVQLDFPESRQRWEFFNDHPWELARPKVVLEDDGRDGERWDWGHALCRPIAGANDPEGKKAIAQWERKQMSQAARPLNGEAVVLRQHWLIRHTGMTEAAAYDKARKELYRARHAQEVESRVAAEEALFYGAFFGPGPLEVGMKLEDKAYESWRDWAAKEVVAENHRTNSAYSGSENEATDFEDPSEQELQEISDSVPASKTGQLAPRGGAAIHP